MVKFILVGLGDDVKKQEVVENLKGVGDESDTLVGTENACTVAA